MSGEMDIQTLLRGMSASMVEGTFVFVTLPEVALPTDLRPRMMFREVEGMTLILLRQEAEAAGLAFEFPCRMITLNVHSSLAAVGFIARIAGALAARGMGVNPVAGFHHDHLFVPEARAGEAMQVLDQLSKGDG